MGRGPKKSDYKASAAEKTAAGTAMAQWQTYEQQYRPILTKFRDNYNNSNNESIVARRNAGADTMQATTGRDKMDMRLAGNTDIETGIGATLASSLGKADAAAGELKNQQGLGVVGGAQQQATSGQQGLMAAAKFKAEENQNRAVNRQLVQQAKFDAAGSVLGAAASRGMSNIKSAGKGATWKDAFRNSVPGPGGDAPKKAGSFAELLQGSVLPKGWKV